MPQTYQRGAKAGFSTSSHAGVAALKKRSPQENKRNAEIDHEPGDIDERCHERRRCAGRIEANAFRMKGSIEPARESEGDNSDKGTADRAGNQHPMLAVIKQPELLPQRDPNDADEAKDRPKHQPAGSSRSATMRHQSRSRPPQRDRSDDQRGRLRSRVAARAHDKRNEQGVKTTAFSSS